MRAPFDPYGAASPAIDQQLGDAFQVVRFVAQHIPEIASVAYHMEGLYTLVSAGGKANADLLGLPADAVNLGEFEGDIIPDDTTVRSALQVLITFVKNLSTIVDGQLTDMGQFSGVTIPDNVNLHEALQSLETAIEFVSVEIPNIASEAEAEAGVNNAKWMTPLRVAQAIEAQVTISTDLAASGGASLIGTTNGDTVQDKADIVDAISGSGPLLIVIAGQSNALGANNGGANPSNDSVFTWDAMAASPGWVSGGQYTALPWTREAPNGNAGNNNFALGAAHYLQSRLGREVYIVLDATGGTSIDAWVASDTASVRYAALKAKIEAALASPAMVAAGKTEVDLFIWAQGEEDFVDGFSTHLTNLNTLDTQLLAESWIGDFTRRFVMGMSKLHDRYEVSSALRHFCNKSNGKWRFISTRGLRTQYDLTATGDFTHWLGDDLYYGGYRLIGPAFLDGGLSSPESDIGLAYSRANGLASPSEPTVIVTYNNLVNWQSRTDGPNVTDNFVGDGATTAFTLTSNGTISQVTVNGVVKTSPADYSVSGLTITFTAAPGDTLPIVVSYGSAINGPAATGSISWGYRCFADGNYSFALGYLNSTGNGTNYTMVGGRDSSATDAADYSFSWGHQLALQNTYQGAWGRGHTLADSGTAAIGTFSTYTTTQTDPATFQVGVGSSSAARSNAFTVRESGVQEQKTTTVAALPAAGTAGRRAFVTDSNVAMTAGIGAIVTAGGANKVPVYDDGSNWRIG